MGRTDQHTIGYVIKVLRTASSLKQKDLARRAGIKSNYLSLVEAGKREPSLSVLRAVAKALGIPVSFLFWESEGLPEGANSNRKPSFMRIRKLLLELEALRLEDQKGKGE